MYVKGYMLKIFLLMLFVFTLKINYYDIIQCRKLISLVVLTRKVAAGPLAWVYGPFLTSELRKINCVIENKSSPS